MSSPPLFNSRYVRHKIEMPAGNRSKLPVDMWWLRTVHNRKENQVAFMTVATMLHQNRPKLTSYMIFGVVI